MRVPGHLVVGAVTVAFTVACGTAKTDGGASSRDSGVEASGPSAGGSGGSGGSGTAGTGGRDGTGGIASSGSGGSASARDSGTGDSGVEQADSGRPDPGPYPAGPYGNKVGNTIINLPLQGYVNETGDAISNTLPWVPAYSLDDVRRTKAAYLLIHVSNFNCSGCRHAARQLGIDGKGILDAGGAVMDILSDNGNRAQLDAWVTTADENVDAFLDATSNPLGALKVATVRETAFIVKVPSMKIVWLVNGDVTGVAPPSIVAAAKEMHVLLGK